MLVAYGSLPIMGLPGSKKEARVTLLTVGLLDNGGMFIA
jgi:hypothetical protein